MDKMLPILNSFIMKAKPEWKAIHEAADHYLPSLTNCYINAFKALRESINEDTLLESSIGFMEDSIDWAKFRAACNKNYEIIAHVIMEAGTQASFYLANQKYFNRTQPVAKETTDEQSSNPNLLSIEIPTIVTTANFEVSATGAFNMRNPKAIDWTVDYVGMNIHEVEDETRKAVRVIIQEALKYGGHPRETAIQIKNFIGLTERQMKAVLKYKDELSQSGLPQSKIDQMVNSEMRKMIRRRAETIARTETIDAANQGQLLHWDDMASQGYLDTNIIKKTWSPTPDDRLCPVCMSLKGETVDINQPFSWGGMRPTRHPKCRCSISLVDIDEKE